MRNLLFVLRFDGSRYHGFQVQKNALSVCEVFQNAVERVFGARLAVKGCSRTDTGVHAENYCISMLCESAIPCGKAVLALNGYLPDDIAVVACFDKPLDFHARYSSTGKEYVYKMLNSRVRDPFRPTQVYRYAPLLDEAFLDAQAQDLVGTHDFSAFSASRAEPNPVRTVRYFRVTRHREEVHFTVAADGFLYNMVRIMVGTLVHIASGKLKAGCIPEILASGDRGRAGKTIPACGLYLARVFYGDEVIG